jgi:hypothetical protein
MAMDISCYIKISASYMSSTINFIPRQTLRCREQTFSKYYSCLTKLNKKVLSYHIYLTFFSLLAQELPNICNCLV